MTLTNEESSPVRLRIAFVARRFGARFGGAEAYAESLLAELAQRHDIQVFCQEWDSPLDLAHTVLPRRRGLPRWLNLAWFTLQCRRRLAGFDIVHSHENTGLGQVQGVHVMPVRYARQQRDRHRWQRLRTALSLRWQAYLWMEARRMRAMPGKVLVVPSSLIAEQVVDAYPGAARQVVITPGVKAPLQAFERHEARAQLALDPGQRYALLVANDPFRKGLEAILQAMSVPAADWRLLVVGGEGAMPERVRTRVAAAGLSERVQIWPGQKDLTPYYAAADVCVFPTLGDAFGMVPLEAMAMGLPVVLSGPRWCGFAQYLEDRRDALILRDPRDARVLAQTVGQVLESPALMRRLAQNGLQVAGRFSWSVIAAAYEAEYYRVLAEMSLPVTSPEDLVDPAQAR